MATLRNKETKRFTVSFDTQECLWCLEEYSERLSIYVIIAWLNNWDTAQSMADMLNARNEDGDLGLNLSSIVGRGP